MIKIRHIGRPAAGYRLGAGDASGGYQILGMLGVAAAVGIAGVLFLEWRQGGLRPKRR